MNSFLFIINPNAGTGKKEDVVSAIKKNSSFTDSEIIFTERHGHGIELSNEAVKKNIPVVVAAGGDGTINEVASALKNTNVKLGIIPLGSGNGFARHLNIPMQVQNALHIIAKGNHVAVDTLQVNNFFSLNVSGIGFDAHVASLFGKKGKRGLWNYVEISVREYFKFKPVLFYIKTSNQQFEEKGIIASFCNTAQFGNNAYISPSSKVNDGKAELVIVKKIPLLSTPYFAYCLFNKKLNQSSYVKTIAANEFEITADTPQPLHIDGDYKCHAEKVMVRVIPSSLNVIVPN